MAYKNSDEKLDYPCLSSQYNIVPKYGTESTKYFECDRIRSFCWDSLLRYKKNKGREVH